MNFVAGHDPVTELNGCKECKSEDGQEEPELEMVNWDQLERDVFTSRKRDNSRFKPCLNLREEIRRQLAEDDAKKNHAQEGKLRKSKSGFLDETSSSDSDNDEMVDVILTDVSTTTSAEDFDDDKEFYLNSEFSTKITLQKAPNGSTFRGSSGSNSRLNSDLSSSPSNSRDLEHLEVRPIQSRPNLKTRIQNLKDLQICFLNDLPVRPSDSPSSGRSSADSAHRTADYLVKMPEGPSVLSQDFWSPPADAFTKSPVNHQLMPKSHSMFEIETEKQKWNKMVISQFEETEARWKQEMQVRIQHAHQSIHLQMQRQRRRHKRTPVSTKVALPHGKTRLDRAFLSDMNITHLQIILNDIHGQIKALNEELVDLLEQRDELHMEQDSTLVDIDDLSRRLRELWMVTFRRKTLPPKDLPDPLNGSTAAFVRKIEDSSGFPNGISDPSVNGNQYSSAQAPSTPTTLSGSLQIFRQRIRSLLQ